MNRIELKFKELRNKGKKAFIAFITAGFPGLKATEELVKELSNVGVDIIELGVPFSDPMADGPVIQAASQAALEKGVCLADILRLVKRLRQAKVETPICLMTYYNPVFCFGEKKFASAANASGVDGVIVPDLPAEEASGFIKSMAGSGIDPILFVSPTTAQARARFIAGKTRGFIYYVSLTGVTGARNSLPADLKKNIKALKKVTAKPVCVGFGVSGPGQVKEVYSVADGVIVGSAIVRCIRENIGKKDMAKRVGSFVARLKNV